MNRFRAGTSLTVPATIALLMAPLEAAGAAEPGAEPASTQEEAQPAPASAPSPLTFHLQVRVNTLAEGRHDAFLDDYRFESILAVPGVSGELTPCRRRSTTSWR